jgi:hypothetical protein
MKKLKETKPTPSDRIDVLQKWRFHTDTDPFQGEILNDSAGVLYKGRQELDVANTEAIDTILAGELKRKARLKIQDMISMARDITKEQEEEKNRKPNIDAMWFGEGKDKAENKEGELSVQLSEKTDEDAEVSVSSIDSEDYKVDDRLRYEKTSYRKSKFVNDEPPKEEPVDEKPDTKKVIWMEPIQRTAKHLAAPNELFIRNTDETKLYTARFMKRMKTDYNLNTTKL